MHLRCPYCHLTLAAVLFENGQQLFSLCYFCRQRALDVSRYFNGDAYYYAQACHRTYTGAIGYKYNRVKV